MRGQNRQSAALLVGLVGLILVGINALSSGRHVAVDVIGGCLLLAGALGFLLPSSKS